MPACLETEMSENEEAASCRWRLLLFPPGEPCGCGDCMVRPPARSVNGGFAWKKTSSLLVRHTYSPRTPTVNDATGLGDIHNYLTFGGTGDQNGQKIIAVFTDEDSARQFAKTKGPQGVCIAEIHELCDLADFLDEQDSVTHVAYDPSFAKTEAGLTIRCPRLVPIATAIPSIRRQADSQ